jgi:FKBP-type peptidyl-prolyl cis-trans isomerase SlyD
MKIAKNRVAAIEYTLKDDKGEVIDASRGEPLYYLHGHANLVSGMEQALEGKGVGDTLELTLSPTEAYGERDESLVLDVPFSDLPDGLEPQKGVALQMNAGGEPRRAVITKVKLRSVVVDTNHPLAGQTLHFNVEVKEVRNALKQELEHGHAHGPGDHHHH